MSDIVTSNFDERTHHIVYTSQYGTGTTPTINPVRYTAQSFLNFKGYYRTITSVRRSFPEAVKTDKDWLRLHPNPCFIKKYGASLSYETENMSLQEIVSKYQRIVGPARKDTRSTWIGIEMVPVHTRIATSDLAPWHESLAGLSLLKAYADMNEAKLNGAVELSQARQTVEMLYNPVRTLIKLYRKPSMRRGLRGMWQKFKAADPRTTMADGWLQYIYGWAPLAGLIQDVIAQFNEQLPTRDLVRSRKRVATRSSIETVQTKDLGGFTLTFLIEEETVRTATTVLHYHVALESLEQLGFRPYDFLNVVYENIPFSFVLNWFYSVEAWMNAYRNMRIAASSCTTCVVEVKRTEKLIGACITAWPLVKVPFVRTTSVQITRAMERRINQPLPAIPQLNSWFLNSNRGLSSVALLWQKAAKFFVKR